MAENGLIQLALGCTATDHWLLTLTLNSRLRIPDWLLLGVVCGFFFFWKLSSFGLIGADEPRYAQVAREMLGRRDLVTPTLGGNVWLEKPPLYYWQAALAYRIFGVSDWSARLPSAVDALLLAFAVWWFLRRLRPGFELDGALMVATSAGVVGFARAASVDMPLAGTFSIAMLAWYAWFESGSKRHLAGFYAWMALAALAKGPVAPFLGALTIAGFCLVQQSADIVRKTLWLPGIAIFFALAAPWYVLVQLRNPQFFRVFILEHNLARFGTNLYHHPEPFWYYIPVTLLGWVPWGAFILAALVVGVRRFRKPDQDSLELFLLIWIALVVGFFSISRSKLPGYILPALPPGIVLASNFVRQKMGEKPKLVSVGLHGLICGGLVFAAIDIRNILIRNAGSGLHVLLAAVAGVMVATLLFMLIMKSGYPMLRRATLIAALLAVGIGLRSGASILGEKLSARSVWEHVSRFNPHHLPVAVFLVPRETEFGLQFYGNETVPRYELGQIPEGEHIVVAAQGYAKSVAKSSSRKAVLLENFAPQKLDFFYVASR